MRQRVFQWIGAHPKAAAAAILVALAVVPLSAQAIIRLTDGTFAQKVVLYTSSGSEGTTVTGTTDVDIVGINGSTPLDATTSGTLQNAATANGNGSTLNVNGYAGVVFSVNCSVSCSGGTTITLEGTEDGTNYVALSRAFRIGTGTIGSAILNQASGTVTVWYAGISGLQAVRARISAYSAGTVTVTARATLNAYDPPAVDPCTYKAKTYYVVNMATATTNEIANAVTGEYWHICSVNLVAAGAQTVSIGEDDTDGCGSITAGIFGGATAATGWSFAANGGIALGDGLGTVGKSATAARYLCIITGQAQQISGTISYVSDTQ
jgi:hypothetical protein